MQRRIPDDEILMKPSEISASAQNEIQFVLSLLRIASAGMPPARAAELEALVPAPAQR
jgi:hypothetical protein